MRPSARFCPSCGAPTDEEVAERNARGRQLTRYDGRAVAAIATIFAGTVFAVVAVWRLGLAGLLESLLAKAVTFFGLVTLSGLVAIVLLGRGAAVASFARPGRAVWCLTGAALGIAAFGFSYFYVGGLYSLRGLGELFEGIDRYPLDLPTVVSIAVLPALFEEWLDRGVLWNACDRVTTPGRTILTTTFLFTFMHGVGSGFLAYPHRFVGGLAMGWLRHRSGSLLPGIAAHFIHNLLCVLVV